MLKLLPLWKAEPLGDGRHGIFLSSHELKAQDGGGGGATDEQLMFRIARQPYFGYLENIATGGGGSGGPLLQQLVSLDLLQVSSC